jgi:hypothetical protein
MEIQQEIIALLAQDLSHQQRMYVVTFASDMRTLPQLDKPNLEPVHTIDLLAHHTKARGGPQLGGIVRALKRAAATAALCAAG